MFHNTSAETTTLCVGATLCVGFSLFYSYTDILGLYSDDL